MQERPPGGGRCCVRGGWEAQLPVGLLLGQPADDGQLDALAVEGVDEHDEPDDEEDEIDKLPQRQGEEDDGWDEILHDLDQNVYYRPGNEEEDRLPGMEADIGTSLEGFDDQENDCRDDGDVGDAAGGVVREAGRIEIGHGSSFEARRPDRVLTAVGKPIERQEDWWLVRENRASQNCSSNWGSLLRTFPTRSPTGQASIFSAGKGRSRSTGGRAGSPGESQRA